MFKSKIARSTFVTSLILAGTMSATPAFAVSQKDIQKCRTAINQDASVDMNDYRLRFLKERGGRNRTLTFKAIAKGDGDSFKVGCDIKRSKVVATNFETATTKTLVQNKKAK